MPILRRLRLPAALLLLACLGGVWYVHWRGGWVNTLLLPPVLDASTPRSQNAYTLTTVSREAEADPTSSLSWPIVAYLLIKPPNFPHCVHEAQMLDGLHIYIVAKGAAAPIVQATAQTSEGDVTPLIWLIVGHDTGPEYLRVQLPGGYSSQCRFINVSLVTNNGPFPCWRLIRLPPMYAAIPRPIATCSHAVVHGVFLTAEAHRIQKMIRLQSAITAPSQAHQWEAALTRQRSEWEGYDAPPLQSSGAWPLSSGHPFTKYDWWPAPYRSASRFVAADYTLRQFETYDEPVTFHGVEIWRDKDGGSVGLRTSYVRLQRSQTITTPSGVTVTLPRQGEGMSNGLMADCLNFYLSIEPLGSAKALPASPLAKAYGKPISVALAFPARHILTAWTNEVGPQHQYAVTQPSIPHLGLQNFTVVIRQRVELQTVPITLTVPVSDTLPPDFFPPRRPR